MLKYLALVCSLWKDMLAIAYIGPVSFVQLSSTKISPVGDNQLTKIAGRGDSPSSGRDAQRRPTVQGIQLFHFFESYSNLLHKK